MEKYGLVLEGGGAKGAYQIGSLKALKECGYKFDCVIGTSIGAINAAFIAQGDDKKLEELWSTLSFEDLMNVNNELMEDILNANVNSEIVSEAFKKIGEAIKKKGIDTNLMRKLFESNIDEEKLRNSKIRFGLVTFCISDMSAEKKFIEDIPEGKVIDYLLATSNLPVFKRQKIDEKAFLDGGAFDNCSVEMLYDEGYRNIVAIRLFKRNRIRNYNKLKRKEDLNLLEIVPSKDLPFILNFDHKTLVDLIKFGYVDTMKQLKEYSGKEYCVKNITDKEIKNLDKIFTPRFSTALAKMCDTTLKVGENIKDVAKTRSIEYLSKALMGKKEKDFKVQVLDIIEYVAKKEEVSNLKIYDFKELVEKTKVAVSKSNKELKPIEAAAYYFIENLPEEK